MEHSSRLRTSGIASAFRGLLWVAGFVVAAASTGAAASEPCGTGSYPFPYTDVGGVTDPFCPGIMEAYVTGISKGTSATTFSPNDPVIRLQMTTFLQRSLDQWLTRASRRAGLNQWWVPQNPAVMQTIALSGSAEFCAADGENIWTTLEDSGGVAELEASTGKNLHQWTGATGVQAVVVAAGMVFMPGYTSPGSLYVIDPTQPPGPVTVAASNLGGFPFGIAFDGTNLWTANLDGSVSIITPAATTPYPAGNVTTVSAGFTQPYGVLYDGTHIWVTDFQAGTLLQLSPTGAILKTVTVGSHPQFPAFDGTNIWVPNTGSNSITVVQASTGNVVATINSDATNNLIHPTAASFDGERILVTNQTANTVTVFKAADLSFIANVSTGGGAPYGVCSDGINFWVNLPGSASLLRF
jgi:YVTN family beta-propeller protein